MVDPTAGRTGFFAVNIVRHRFEVFAAYAAGRFAPSRGRLNDPPGTSPDNVLFTCELFHARRIDLVGC
jgi:hypothetical protein